MPGTTSLDHLRVVLDVDGLSGTPIESYLIGLLECAGGIESLRYSDAGPPEAEIRRFEPTGDMYARGWLTVEPEQVATFSLAATAVHSLDGTAVTRSAVDGGDRLNVPLHYILQQLGSPESRHEQVRRDLLLVLACEAIGAKILITNRSSLINRIDALPGWRYDTSALRPDEAVAVVGLWLRATGRHIVYAGMKGTATVDRALFFSVAADGLVPERWRWARAIPNFPSDDRVHARDMLLALHGRIALALKDRDRERIAGFKMSPSDARDEAVDCVVSVALHLMGAFDAAAQLLELVSPTGALRSDVGWQRKDWLKMQRGQIPSAIEAASRHRSIFHIVQVLRNTVHSRLLDTVTVVARRAGGDQRDDHMVLPQDETEKLRRAFNASGGLTAWSVRELRPGHLYADPSRLVDRMISQSGIALNEILAATPLETQLQIDSELSKAPSDIGIIETAARSHIAAQIGLRISEPQQATPVRR